ncbi:hypothetical protein TanjilG_07178 [Lupinus angustifolius]|uniref:Uncharacterized protein n=1 Tax=Lupinus angustifolius TaxID=3871 RepID=A0A394DEH5_LUPAN|nr:PREDICTED: uncharacterized protein LOC109340305 [Lupinus angustifolius]OIW21652.1 hypothetical protein TanjilG_07178 [Lupinus angustifolius]
MGNFLAPCTCMSKHGKFVRVVKPDGKVLKFNSPINVKDIMTNFPAFGIGISKEATHLLSLNHEMNAGRLYHLIPSMCSPPIIKKQGNAKRIKVVITKQQLQQLVTKEISIEDILTEVKTFDVDFSYKQKPKLETILEENEW